MTVNSTESTFLTEEFSQGLLQKINPNIQRILVDESAMGYKRYVNLTESDNRARTREIVQIGISELGLSLSNIGIHFLLDESNISDIFKRGFELTQNHLDAYSSDTKTIFYYLFTENTSIDTMSHRHCDAFMIVSRPELKRLSLGENQRTDNLVGWTVFSNDQLIEHGDQFYMPQACVIGFGGMTPHAVAEMKVTYGEQLGLTKGGPKQHEANVQQITEIEEAKTMNFTEAQWAVYKSYRLIESLALDQATHSIQSPIKLLD